MTPENRFSIHRFHDFVAFSSDSCPTVYLSATMAHDLAAMLALYSADISSQIPFSDSLLSTAVVEEGKPIVA